MTEQTVTTFSGTPLRRAALNGLDIAAISRAIQTIAQDPAEGRLAFKVRTDWKGGMRLDSRIDAWEQAGKEIARGHHIATDEPVGIGGSDTAANPQEMLLAALNACIAVGFVVECTRRGIGLISVRIEARGALDLRGFFGLDPWVTPGMDPLALRVVVRADAAEHLVRAAFASSLRRSPNRWNISLPAGYAPELIIEQ